MSDNDGTGLPASKDELLILMVDSALGAPPAAAPDERWRAGPSRWAHAALASYRRHTWGTACSHLRLTGHPAQHRLLKQGLRCLQGTGLT